MSSTSFSPISHKARRTAGKFAPIRLCDHKKTSCVDPNHCDCACIGCITARKISARMLCNCCGVNVPQDDELVCNECNPPCEICRKNPSACDCFGDEYQCPYNGPCGMCALCECPECESDDENIYYTVETASPLVGDEVTKPAIS